MRLTGFPFEAVDELPVSGGDELGLAGGQPFGELVAMVLGKIRELPGVAPAGQVVAQGVDRVLLSVGAGCCRGGASG